MNDGTAIRIDTPADLQAVMGTSYAPSAQQWEAISAPLRPAVVIAGAGSGKTTLMAARVVYLVVTGQVRPEEILGLTFTTKAASELRVRIRDALRACGVLDVDERRGPRAAGAATIEGDPEETSEPTVLTYNAYAANLLADYGLRIGHEPDTRVITDAARYQLGARVVDGFTGNVEQLSDHPPTVIQNLLALDGAMSEHLVGADDVRRVDAWSRRGFDKALADEESGKNRKTYKEPMARAIFAIDRRTELLELVDGYRRLKGSLGLMDFSDQIELGARLADEQPEVGAAERTKFRVVLLDEYQDTSVAQAIMLGRLFSGPDTANGRGHAVTAVGDPHQAIYGWRGASVSNILNFDDTFPGADGSQARTYPLTVNRRSERRILAVANRLARPLLDRYEQVEPLVPDPRRGEGVVEAAVYETRAEELQRLAGGVWAAANRGTRWSEIGVLTRDNSHAAAVFDALSDAQIPVEIVGLSGLLRLPEVAELVAMLHLLDDVTANESMLTVLTGARWAIGPRDLRLLARRAQQLTGGTSRAEHTDVMSQLVAVADGIDAAELPCLDDALADPGHLPYSTEARQRFALLAGELRALRTHTAEPLLDIVRRIIDVTGVDVELASAISPAAAARRDNLDLFVKAVAEFQAVDGQVSLAALLAYLTAEDEQGKGLDLATPTMADSVKLLTVHRSKGLEWDEVFLVGVCETRFPSNKSRMLWTSSPQVLPAPLRGDARDLPQLAGFDKAALEAYRADTKAHDADEELRLGYVAVTRAAHRLSVTSYCWSERSTPFGPSAYQELVKEQLEEWGERAEPWSPKPGKGDPHPYDDVDSSEPWPQEIDGLEAAARRDAAERVRVAEPGEIDEGLDMIEVARVGDWDAELDRLLAEARAERGDTRTVQMPSSLSASAVLRMQEDREGFVDELVRPMPRPPARAARFGTQFHSWVETRFGQQGLFDDDALPGRADEGIDDPADLGEVIQAFEAGPFAERVPHAMEAPFALVVAGHVIRGRIDAVYTPTPQEADDHDFLVVDWKTGRSEDADPLQLAIYRLAWADLHGIAPERVRAAFVYVRSGQMVEPTGLPGRDELDKLLQV